MARVNVVRLGGLMMVLALGSATAGEFPDPAKLPLKPDLPDPLVMFNGQKVATKEQWFKERRPGSAARTSTKERSNSTGPSSCPSNCARIRPGP